jgi:multiple sugar transport system substrate-binding protein
VRPPVALPPDGVARWARLVGGRTNGGVVVRRLPVVLCCAAVFVAGACTPGVHESNVDPKTVVVFLPSDNAGDIQLRQAQADAFMKEHPDIPVDVTVIPVEAYDQKITTSIGGGATVDIFNTGEVLLPSLLDRGFTLDLNQFVDKESYSEKGFYPQVIDGLTVQGHLMGLADNWDTQVMYYNRDLFDKAGLDYPDGTWDWNEFVDAARQLTAGEGTKKVYGAVHEAWFAPLWDRIWSEGGQVFNQDGTRCMLDDPNSVRAIQSLADLYSQGISPSQPQIDQGALDPLQLFLANRSAMWIGSGRWAAFDLKDAKNLNWAIAPIPNGTDHPRANFFHLSLYSIAARSDSPDNAWEFLKFMVSPEGIDLGLQSMQGIPSREKIANAPGFRNDSFVKEHDAYEPFIESLKTVHTAPYLVRFDEAENAMSAGLSPVWRGERTAEQVAQGICDEVDHVLSADE